MLALTASVQKGVSVPKLNQQELMDFALSQVPPSGEIVYADLYNKIRASANPEAVAMLPALKASGVLAAKLEVQPDGKVKHTYSRKVAP